MNENGPLETHFIFSRPLNLLAYESGGLFCRQKYTNSHLLMTFVLFKL